MLSRLLETVNVCFVSSANVFFIFNSIPVCFTGRWRYFTQMSAQYGDLFACTLPGGRQWLVACSAHALRETISGPNEDAFSGRPDFDAEMLGISEFLIDFIGKLALNFHSIHSLI